MKIKKSPNEFTAYGGIPEGAQTFTGVTLGPNCYGWKIHDISILPSRAKQNGEPLTQGGSHYALNWGN